MAQATERLWRLRKDHTWIDARVRECGDAGAVELQYFYDGALVFVRVCASRDAAVADAADQRRDFQRAGWNTHW